MRKGTPRADYVPAEPIRKALVRYLRENGEGEKKARSEHVAGGRKHKYSDAYCLLAEKIGVKPDSVHNWTGRGRQSMQFDVADRILAAIGQVSLWWQDPDLSEVYERACQGADRIYPLELAA